MPTREEFVAEVDAFLLARKTLAGIEVPGHWQPGRDNVWQRLRLPVEVDGTQEGHRALDIEFDPTSQNMVFTINLLCHACISRLDFDSTGGHTNNFLIEADIVSMIVSGPHFHRWMYNRRFADGSKRLITLNNAEAIPQTIHSFDSALRWFCDETNIELPHGHWIELPPRTLV